MRILPSAILTGLILVCTAHTAQAATPVSRQDWDARPGDELIVDVDSNMGYLLRADTAEYLPFTLATGQQRMVRYLGMKYFAATPKGSWVVKNRKIQNDRITFGPTGRFLRLNNTHYGIHSFKYVNDWLESEDRYRSFGCIVVTEDMMDLIEEIYRANDNELNVTTTGGADLLLHALAVREEKQRVGKLAQSQPGLLE